MSSEPSSFKNIPEHRRELYFRVINDLEDFHPITLRLFFLDDHFPLHKLDSALQWLIANGFVGKQFMGWFKTVCQSSDLEMHRLLLAIVDNLQLAPIIIGRNFRA